MQRAQPQVQLNIPGLIYEQIPHNGHCLYNAVAIYLNRSQELLREDVASHLTRYLDEFRGFLETQIGQSAESYIQGIRHGTEWAGNAEIEILMRVFGRPIIIISMNGGIRNLDTLQRFHGDPIYVFYNGHNHYDGFLRIPKISNEVILANLRQLNEQTINTQPIPPLVLMKY
jgi:hypothetical protein